MKRILVATLACLWVTGAWAATNTNVVAFAVLKVTPEKYCGKKVVYVERFRNLMTSFPEYMVRSGIKEDRHVLLTVGGQQLPVIARKSEKTVETIAELKPGAMVRVEGRVRQFDIDPRRGGMPRYYVDMDMITIDKDAPPAPMEWFNQGERRDVPIRKLRRGKGDGM